MKLHYVDEGPGPVLVLLHGYPLDHSMWNDQRVVLGSIYRVIAPDLRGHGQSEAPVGIYPIDDMANDVVELLDSLKIAEPVVVGGLSMGGYLALSLAVRFPKRLRGLILMNTRAGADTPETARVREELAQTVEAAGNVDVIVETMLPRLVAQVSRTRHPELVDELQAVMSRTAPKGVAGTLRGMAARPDRTADLARINIPTLVMAGALDALIPIEESRSMTRSLPNAELVVIPEAGHLAPRENPSTANAAILRFLGTLA